MNSASATHAAEIDWEHTSSGPQSDHTRRIPEPILIQMNGVTDQDKQAGYVKIPVPFASRWLGHGGGGASSGAALRASVALGLATARSREHT